MFNVHFTYIFRKRTLYCCDDGSQLPMDWLLKGEELYETITNDIEELSEKVLQRGEEHNDVDFHSFVMNKLSTMIDDYHPCQKKAIKSMINSHFLIECIINGCNNMSELSVNQYLSYNELGGVEPILKDGYGKLIENLLSKLPKDVVKYNKEVINISYRTKDSDFGFSSPCKITCKDGKHYEADYVVFTGSIGVLKNNHNKLFEPSLPLPYINSIENLGYDAVDKIMFQFDDLSFLPNDVADISFYWDIKEKSDTSNLPAWCRSICGLQMLNSPPVHTLLGT